MFFELFAHTGAKERGLELGPSLTRVGEDALERSAARAWHPPWLELGRVRPLPSRPYTLIRFRGTRTQSHAMSLATLDLQGGNQTSTQRQNPAKSPDSAKS